MSLKSKIERMLTKSKKRFTYKQLASWFQVSTGSVGMAVKFLDEKLASRIYSSN